MWLRILIGLSIITMVHGYTGGLFPQSCVSMSPGHPSKGGQLFGPQNTQPPFEVHYQHGKEGMPITVFLQSKQFIKFKGFMLEARKKGMVDDGRPVGKFITLDSSTRLLTCSGLVDSAVSQTDNRKKTLIRVNWTAEGAELDITFRATFLESYDKFWERVDVNVTLPPHTTPLPLLSSTQPSTTTSMEPSTTSTTKPSTIASTTEPSTTSTTKPSTITSTTEPSTTSNKMPSTITSTTEPSTTSTTKPSTTSITTLNNTQQKITLKKATVLMTFDIVFVGLKLELPNIVKITLTNSPLSHHLNKGLELSCGLLCAAVEISVLILFYVGDSFKVALVALVCVVIVITFIELVITSLPIGPTHELKEICDLAVKVCSVIHMIFSNAVIFIGVLEIDCSKNKKESWPLKVMVAYTVWISLFVIWGFIFSTQRKEILGRRKTGSSENSETRRQQRKKKKLSAAEGIATAISVILVVGNISFTAAAIVGIGGQACA